MNRLKQLKAIQKQAYKLFARKNADYGDAFAKYGSVGVLVRLGDKINRLTSIEARSIILVDNESVRDTLIDLHNYSAMAIMCLDNQSCPQIVPGSMNQSSLSMQDEHSDSIQDEIGDVEYPYVNAHQTVER